MTRPQNQVLEFDLELTGRTHELKTWPVYYDAIAEGQKQFELRIDDRRGGFHVGDVLVLREWDPEPPHGPGSYSGRSLERVVTYVMRYEGTPAIIEPSGAILFGWAILGLALLPSS